MMTPPATIGTTVGPSEASEVCNQVYSVADDMKAMESKSVMHFEKAPIVEALIGLELEEPAALDFLTSVGEILAGDYPDAENILSDEFMPKGVSGEPKHSRPGISEKARMGFM